MEDQVRTVSKTQQNEKGGKQAFKHLKFERPVASIKMARNFIVTSQVSVTWKRQQNVCSAIICEFLC